MLGAVGGTLGSSTQLFSVTRPILGIYSKVRENFFCSHKSKKKYISMIFSKIVFLNFSIQAAPFSHGPIGTLKTPAWGGAV